MPRCSNLVRTARLMHLYRKFELVLPGVRYALLDCMLMNLKIFRMPYHQRKNARMSKERRQCLSPSEMRTYVPTLNGTVVAGRWVISFEIENNLKVDNSL